MPSERPLEKIRKDLETHARGLATAIGKVEKYDKGLADQLNREYDGLLGDLYDLFDSISRRIERTDGRPFWSRANLIS